MTKGRRWGFTTSSTFIMFIVGTQAFAEDPKLLRGAAAFGDWQTSTPGVRRLITPADLPKPYATPSQASQAGIVPLPVGAAPQLPPGFKAGLFARDLRGPRTIVVAPNGDLFVAESWGGRIRVLRAGEDAAKPSVDNIYASGFNYPYGLAFYPPGPDPTHLYVAQQNRVFRFPYANGDLRAAGQPEIVANLPSGGHATRSIAFSPEGKDLFVAVGSASNVAQGLTPLSAEELTSFEAEHGLGATWGVETNRAAVLAFDPEGGNGRIFATGIRNCSGLAVDPAGALWCATNERDGLGDDLPPDYVSRIREGKFYGWPWFYIGDNQDPRHAGARPGLVGKVTIPDVLIQPHSAPLNLTFYEGAMFPEGYRGDGFATLHGSWNRGHRTGYKVVRIIMKDGVPTGEYEDFATGFVSSDELVWGRPVGVAVGKDGALFVSEDANNTIWRITYEGPKTSN